MKTTFRSNAKFFLVTMGLWLLVLALCPHRAAAQTNTFPSSGSAGVGTTSPSGTKLHVVHNTGGEATVLAEAGSSMSPAMEFKDAAATPNRWRIGSGWGSTTDGLFFIFDKRQSAARMIIDTSGNVGIGTASPLQKLQLGSNTITGSATPDAISLGASYSNTAGANPKLRLFDDGANSVYGLGISASQFDFMIPTGTRYAWNINGAEKMRLDNSGNLGIGTTTPSAKLHIVSGTDNGTALLNLDTGVHGGTSMLVYGSANNESGYDLSVYRAGQYISRFGVNNSGNVYLQANGGNVGVGTVSPGYRLDVQGGQLNSSGGLCIAGDCKTAWSQVGGGGSSQWTTTGANIYYNSGSVGVGTAAPGYSLDVLSNAQWVARFKKTDATNGGIIVDAATGYNPNLALSVNGAVKWYMNSNTSNGDTLQFWESTGATPRFTLTQAGNVGIGTASPTAKLHVYGSGNMAGIVQSTTAGAEFDLISSATNYGSWGMGTGWATAGVRSFYLYDNVASAARLVVDASGNVGIGTTTPSASYKLDVNGGINASNINSTGNITASGSIAAKYQDVAEWVPASDALPAGTVVTLDPSKSNHVEASTHAYDTRVAGVVSEQPGITLGESGENKVLVATTGRVRVTVDASHAPIHIGDLLVTSDITGVAMKSEPITIGGRQIHSPGTLIGKALEPLEQGSGKILVLLSLQ